MNYDEMKVREAMGEVDHQPYIEFFDHAIENRFKSKESGRPRFASQVFIRKIPSAPDLIVRDVFDRQMVEQDKTDYPEQWQRYCERKSKLDNFSPPITAIPGMTVAYNAELRALGIQYCEQFVAFERDLDELEPLRETARKIMEIAHEIRAQRDDVRVEERRQPDRDSSVSRPSPKIQTQKEGFQGFDFQVSF